MPTTTSKARSSTQKAPSALNPSVSSVTFNELIKNEIARLSETQEVSTKLLEEFASFVIEHHKKKDPKPKAIKPKETKVKPLTLAQLKGFVYRHFGVVNTAELKKSGSFKMATDGMADLNLSGKEGWEKLYRKFIGILPGEENQQGLGCINGINIFNYFRPWQVFGLDSETATPEEIKKAYYELSKIYHPDMPEGDAQIFDRINIMYKSISAEA
jgi:DnaJ domain